MKNLFICIICVTVVVTNSRSLADNEEAILQELINSDGKALNDVDTKDLNDYEPETYKPVYQEDDDEEEEDEIAEEDISAQKDKKKKMADPKWPWFERNKDTILAVVKILLQK